MVAPLLLAAPAQAGIDACGNIDVEANAMCEMRVEGGCLAECEPVAVTASCAADLYVECNGECNAEIDASCTGSCEASCMGECDVDPGTFDCQGSCEASCDADCNAECSASANQGECRASCRATCSGKCEGSCEATPTTATCEGKCQASCQGQCEARAEMDCQIDCQGTAMADCQAEVTGGCEVACSRPEGALFCDGQYVDHGGNLDECVDALRDALDIEVSGYASAQGGCEGNQCSASAEAGGEASCAVAPNRPLERSLPAGIAAMIAALAFATRRRRD